MGLFDRRRDRTPRRRGGGHTRHSEYHCINCLLNRITTQIPANDCGNGSRMLLPHYTETQAAITLEKLCPSTA